MRRVAIAAAVVGVDLAGARRCGSRPRTRRGRSTRCPTRAWELGIGALLAVGAARLARIPPRASRIALWAGLGLIVLSAVAIGTSTPFPGVAALLPTLGAGLVILAGSSARLGATQVAARPAPAAVPRPDLVLAVSLALAAARAAGGRPRGGPAASGDARARRACHSDRRREPALGRGADPSWAGRWPRPTAEPGRGRGTHVGAGRDGDVVRRRSRGAASSPPRRPASSRRQRSTTSSNPGRPRPQRRSRTTSRPHVRRRGQRRAPTVSTAPCRPTSRRRWSTRSRTGR